MMTKQEPKKDLYIRAIEFGLRHPDGFAYNDILRDKILDLTDEEKKIISRHLYYAYLNCPHYRDLPVASTAETLFQCIGGSSSWQDDTCQYLNSLDSYFKYIDFQELRFARQNASEARSLSVKAIGVSIFAIIISAIIPVLVAWSITQTVKIEDGQLEVLKTRIAPSD